MRGINVAEIVKIVTKNTYTPQQIQAGLHYNIHALQPYNITLFAIFWLLFNCYFSNYYTSDIIVGILDFLFAGS